MLPSLARQYITDKQEISKNLEQTWNAGNPADGVYWHPVIADGELGDNGGGYQSAWSLLKNAFH